MLSDNQFYSNTRQLTMTFQYIVDHLGKPHSWYVVLTGPHVELDIKRKLEQQGFITYVPFDSIQRHWAGRTKKIHIPTITRCVLVYTTNEEIQRIQKEYVILPFQTITALYQSQ